MWIEHRCLEEISPFGVSVLHHFEANAQTVDETQMKSSTNMHTKKPNLIWGFFFLPTVKDENSIDFISAHVKSFSPAQQHNHCV